MSLGNSPEFLLNFSVCEMNGEEKHFYQFKSFRLDVGERQLLHNDVAVPLQPKAFDVLAALVERSGHLIEKDELLRLVWSDSFVEEANVARIVHTLRKVLGENENGNKFIETVAKSGYRFVAEVDEIRKENEKHSKNDSIETSIPKPANAYQAYQLARYHFNQLTPTDLIKSRSLLEEAVRFDADFAVAHAALAEQSVMEGMLGFRAPIEIFPKAKESLRRAAELNPHSTEFYTAAGFINLICDWNFAQAEENLRKALELNPHNSLANNYLGQTFMFRCQPEEAEFYLRRAVEIEPLAFNSRIVLMIAYFLGRNYQKAEEECEKMLAVYPHFFNALWMRCSCLEQTGRASEAIAEYEKILHEPNGELVRRWMGYAYALLGDTENALATAARVEAERQQAYFISQTHLAALYAALKDTDKAISYLENAVAECDPWLLWLATDPRFDNLRFDPRFDDLIQRINFQNAADEYEICEPNSPKAVALKESEMTMEDSELRSEKEVNPQSKTRIVLFAVGFLSAIFLLLLLSFNFQPASSVNSSAVKSIAVLPVQPLTAENRDSLYEFGIADSLINKLSSAKGLVVRPLSATRQYADIEQDAVAAGREQKVEYVLASNYQIADGKIRVTSQLINVQNGAVEEVFTVEENVANRFAAQDAVTANLGQSILKRLNQEPNDLAIKRYTTNDEAYRLYLQGTALADKRNRTDFDKAIEYFEQAVKLDPNYALAYAGLANAQTAMALEGGGDSREQYPKAKAAIEKALAIDDNLAEAHSYSGEIKFVFEWDFAGAEREHKRAVELNPNSSAAHRMYALLLSQPLGRFDEAIAEIKIAIDLEPASVLNRKIYGQTLYYARRYDEAVIELKRTIEMNADFSNTYNFLIFLYRAKGDDAEAFEWFVQKQTQIGDQPDEIQSWKTIYAKSGWRGVSERQLEQAKEDEKNGKPNYVQLAFHSIELEQRDAAFAYLEKAFGKRRWAMTMLKVEPRFDALRSDARFDDLVRRVGLK